MYDPPMMKVTKGRPAIKNPFEPRRAAIVFYVAYLSIRASKACPTRSALLLRSTNLQSRIFGVRIAYEACFYS